MKKTLYVLNIGGYAPEICSLTYPLIQRWANKIGADVHLIHERRFPEWPIVYEKLQIYELAQQNRSDWHIYIDSDTLVHPQTIDFTNFLPRDTIAHNGTDFANVKCQYDEFFLRDGRNIWPAGWLAIASSWCIDLWRPLEMELDQVLQHARLTPKVDEATVGLRPTHFVEEYALSSNIARFGLKVTTIPELMQKNGVPEEFSNGWFWHDYLHPVEEKARMMREVLERWGVA